MYLSPIADGRTVYIGKQILLSINLNLQWIFFVKPESAKSFYDMPQSEFAAMYEGFI